MSSGTIGPTEINFPHPDRNGATPLMHACAIPNGEYSMRMVTILLEAGADFKKKNLVWNSTCSYLELIDSFIPSLARTH